MISKHSLYQHTSPTRMQNLQLVCHCTSAARPMHSVHYSVRLEDGCPHHVQSEHVTIPLEACKHTSSAPVATSDPNRDGKPCQDHPQIQRRKHGRARHAHWCLGRRNHSHHQHKSQHLPKSLVHGSNPHQERHSCSCYQRACPQCEDSSVSSD